MGSIKKPITNPKRESVSILISLAKITTTTQLINKVADRLRRKIDELDLLCEKQKLHWKAQLIGFEVKKPKSQFIINYMLTQHDNHVLREGSIK